MVAKLISLKKDKERRSSFYDKWQNLCIPITWIPAIDGNEPLRLKEVMKTLQITEEGEIPRFYSGYRGTLKAGELGCSLSHLVALSEFLESTEDFLFILEDDSQPMNVDLINDILQNIRAYDFDLFLLGFRKNKMVPKKISTLFWKALFTFRVWKPRSDFDQFLIDSLASWKSKRRPIMDNGLTSVFSSGSHYGTYAYIVNRRAAKELKHLLSSLKMRSDEAITFANQSMRLKIITTENPLVRVNADFISNIRDQRAQSETFAAHGV